MPNSGVTPRCVGRDGKAMRLFFLTAVFLLCCRPQANAGTPALGQSPVLRTTSLGPPLTLRTASLGKPAIITPASTGPSRLDLPPEVLALRAAPPKIVEKPGAELAKQTASAAARGSDFLFFKVESALANAKAVPNYEKYPELVSAISAAEDLLKRK